MYHAYLGLAALATLAGQDQETEEGIGRFDPRLCIGAEAAARVRRGREALLTPEEDSDSSEDERDAEVRRIIAEIREGARAWEREGGRERAARNDFSGSVF